MAISVTLQKRKLKSKKRNGQHNHVWHLRWRDATGEQCGESTGTADRTCADELRKAKWVEVNGLGPEPAAEVSTVADVPAEAGPTWAECRAAVERELKAANKRPGTVADYLLNLDVMARQFTQHASPADVTAAEAREYFLQRSEVISPWTLRSDLTAWKAIYNKWLRKVCGVAVNPFAGIDPPECDEPDKRIVTSREKATLFRWMDRRWHNWRLPLLYLELLEWTGWRPIEVASMRTADLLPDGLVRVLAESCKTRQVKFQWCAPEMYDELKQAAAGGFLFGGFSGELRLRLTAVHKRPHHAAKVRDYAPQRLVGWIQDELQRFNDLKAKHAKRRGDSWERFTLYDFRKTAITMMKDAGIAEEDASRLVGTSPEVMRKHYLKVNPAAMARKLGEQRRLSVVPLLSRSKSGSVDSGENRRQTITA